MDTSLSSVKTEGSAKEESIECIRTSLDIEIQVGDSQLRPVITRYLDALCIGFKQAIASTNFENTGNVTPRVLIENYWTSNKVINSEFQGSHQWIAKGGKKLYPIIPLGAGVNRYNNWPEGTQIQSKVPEQTENGQNIKYSQEEGAPQPPPVYGSHIWSNGYLSGSSNSWSDIRSCESEPTGVPRSPGEGYSTQRVKLLRIPNSEN